jgi:hypothetical protein
MISQAIHDHVSTFQLISNHASWLESYETLREVDSDPAFDKLNKTHAILQATLEALAAAKRLRIKRFTGYTGLGYDRKWYNEIQLLDEHHQVIETIVGSVAGDDIPTIEGNVAHMQRPVLRWDDDLVVEDNTLAHTLILLPTTFPNYPEFRDENGNPFEGWWIERGYAPYYQFVIVMEKEFVTEECVTEEMRNEMIKKCTVEQCKTIKEELIMNRWSPTRVEQLLEAGYDIEDM